MHVYFPLVARPQTVAKNKQICQAKVFPPEQINQIQVVCWIFIVHKHKTLYRLKKKISKCSEIFRCCCCCQKNFTVFEFQDFPTVKFMHQQEKKVFQGSHYRRFASFPNVKWIHDYFGSKLNSKEFLSTKFYVQRQCIDVFFIS